MTSGTGDMNPTTGVDLPSSGRLSVAMTRRARSTYVTLLLYPWVILGLGVVVGGCRERVGRGR